jgi:Tfp pilus assembly protein PilZ
MLTPAASETFDERSDGPGTTRAAVDLSATVNNERTSYKGILRNLRVDGAFVVTHRAHEVGEWIELRISLPDGGAPVRAIGEVRWTREYAGEHAASPGMAVEFASLSPQDAVRIVMYLDRCGPVP